MWPASMSSCCCAFSRTRVARSSEPVAVEIDIVIKVAVVGLGKMGLSHYAMVNAHPDVEVVGICDSSSYVLGVLEEVHRRDDLLRFRHDAGQGRAGRGRDRDAFELARANGARRARARPARLLREAVHAQRTRRRGARRSGRASEAWSRRSAITTDSSAPSTRSRRLLDAGAIGDVTHVLGEAYGPVVLKPKGGTWRSQRTEGGGCLYDYAAHVIDLVNWYVGEPVGVGGTVLNSVFSREIDDEVFSTLYFPGGKTAQISVNWSDESYRKMTTRVTVWGTKGRIFVDRQECQVYLRDTATPPAGYEHGWNVRYTTELTEPVWFYLRGEEYSAQIDSFVQRVKERRTDGINRFQSAGVTDKIIGMMIADAEKGASTARWRRDDPRAAPAWPRRRRRATAPVAALTWRGP